MKKKSMLKDYQQKIMDHGVAHLVYQQQGVDNIIHPFSEKGYEMLSDEFISFLEKYRSLIPPKVPILLEITGDPLSEEERELIDKTIWAHFCISMTKIDTEVKDILKTSLRFLLFTILSTVLIFAVSHELNEIVSNLGYMPFNFFGYRVLIYLAIDCIPVWKQRTWYRRLASMKLVFSGQDSRSFDTHDLSKITDEFLHYEELAEADTRDKKMVKDYLMENGKTQLGCTVSSLEDLVQNQELNGREYLSDAMAAYLLQAEPFIDSSSPVSLQIRGPQFREEEQQSVIRAVRNYYGVRMATEEDGSRINLKKILIFGLFAALSALALAFFGEHLDVALHECVIMAFWFFGDYLLEFTLISQPGYKETLKTLENCRNMTVTFEQSEN